MLGRLHLTFVPVGALLLAAVASPPALAEDGSADTFIARLNGFQEVPSVSTTGAGTFRATLSNGSLDYRLRYSDLENDVTQAHVHFGQRGVNGGVSAFLCSNADGAPKGCPIRGGEVTGTITAADVIGPEGQGIAAGEFEELVRAMRASATYANVHTTEFGAGEIRGQIRPVLPDRSAR